MNACLQPLDPIDIEALASEEPPLFRPDAGRHAGECPACGEAVRRSQRLASLLAPPADIPVELTQRVLRVRPFSRAERSSVVVWSAPLALLAALSASGTALVAGVARVGDQVGLAAALAASIAGLLRASLRWLADLARTAPAALEALSESLRSTSIGWAALLLLVPLGFGLSRVLARAFARR